MSAPYHDWHNFYLSIRDNQLYTFIFRYFSVYDNMIANSLPSFFQVEWGLYNDMEEINFTPELIQELAPIFHHLLSLVGKPTVLFLDLMIENGDLRGAFNELFNIVLEHQDPDFLPCFGGEILRSELFSNFHQRAHSFLFQSERSTVETLVSVYSFMHPFYDVMPLDLQLDHHSIQAYLVNIEAEANAPYNPDPWYHHPQFFGPPEPEPIYPPGWNWDDLDDPEVLPMASLIADLSVSPRGR
jgi:hypothetical protein